MMLAQGLIILMLGLCIRNVQSSRSDKYAIVVDAGSTGCRAFAFRAQFTSDYLKSNVTNSKIGKNYPGLSTFASNPEDAVDYMIPLLLKAKNAIPVELHSTTKVYVKGTAGMRLISEEDQSRIWKALVDGLKNSPEIPFIIDENNFGTISGSQEAYYAVLSSNFIAGSIDENLR